MPRKNDRWIETRVTWLPAGGTVNTWRIFLGRLRRPAILLLASLLLTIPASADTFAGISAGPARACPDPGCTCMAEGQAGSLGYTRCSGNETPCFRDSFGRPLYCYRTASSADCAAADCNESVGPQKSPAVDIRLVITMQVSPRGPAACEEAGSDACAPPVAEPVPAAVDPLGSILAFFRSLLGMQ